MFEHSHGRKDIKPPGYVAVIILEKFDFASETFLPGPLARNNDLLVREIEGFDANSVASGHVQCEGSPSAAGFHDTFAWLKLKFAANIIHLGDLRVFEGRGGRREIAAGVDEL